MWAASVGYHTERDMFQREKYQSSLTWELWRVWQARAAQPQQAVAVTDEVLTGITSVHHQMGMVCLTYKHSEQTQVAVRAFRAALSAHKTGEEE